MPYSVFRPDFFDWIRDTSLRLLKVWERKCDLLADFFGAVRALGDRELAFVTNCNIAYELVYCTIVIEQREIVPRLTVIGYWYVCTFNRTSENHATTHLDVCRLLVCAPSIGIPSRLRENHARSEFARDASRYGFLTLRFTRRVFSHKVLLFILRKFD